MMMPIFLLGSYFGGVQDQSKDNLDRMSRTYILNLFHMCKVCLIYPTCIRDVSHNPKDAYILERLGVHFTHTFFGGIFFSLGWQWSNVLSSTFRASWCSVFVEYYWWDILALCDICGWLTIWKIFWLKHPADHRNTTILHLCLSKWLVYYWLVFHRSIGMFYQHFTFMWFLFGPY